MIIKCINCNKNFNLDPKLIPESGRLIQCGSCLHKWFYKKKITTSKEIIDEIVDTKINEFEVQSTSKIEEINVPIQDPIEIIDNPIVDGITHNKDYKNKNVSNFFSYLIVFVISFIALVIIIDTIKLPLIDILPGLEIVLFNLFETLKDIKLFIIDLT